MNQSARLEMELNRVGDARYTLRFRFWLPENKAEINLGVSQSLLVSIDFQALRLQQLTPNGYGTALRDQVFAQPEARQAWKLAKTLADSNQVPLSIRLNLDPSALELQMIRWETILDPESGLPVCTNENIYFSRLLSSSSVKPFSPPRLDMLRSLVLISSPADADSFNFAPIDVQQELETAKKALSGLEEPKILASEGMATLDRLIAGLRGGCDVLYLVAHGSFNNGKPYILLEKSQGNAAPTYVSDIMNRLGELQRLPLLAILISCESLGTGKSADTPIQVAFGPQLIAAGIPAVIAMQGQVSYATISQFIPALFAELRSDGQIDRALAVARGQTRTSPDWWMPVLFSRLSENVLYQPAPPLVLKWFEPETVPVPEGIFWMGRDAGEGIPAHECPQHLVDLPAYRIGKFPVTNRQFAEYIAKTHKAASPDLMWNGQSPPADRLDFPVMGVTWYEAMAYCDWLSTQTGRKYTLPNEAQWEKAARGEDGRLYPWGNEWEENRCNANIFELARVDQYPEQTPYHCYDMVGNAREWTLSLWGTERSAPDLQYRYEWKTDSRNDPNAGIAVRRIYRGGAANSHAEMTCTARNGYAPDKSGAVGRRHGFRVVLID